jgi:hypothetical protein
VTYLRSYVTGSNDAILGDVGRTTAVSPVGTHHKLGTGARLNVTDARNLRKPVKVALRMRDRVAQTQDELLTWIKNLNP